MNAFNVGDRVTWTSQAGGSVCTKVGTVAAAVPPGALPNRTSFPRLYRHSGVGGPRPEVSYVVAVGNTIYWPRAAGLLAVQPDVDAFIDRMGPRVTRVQKDLIRRCAALRGDEAEEVLGGLVRMMLEPNITFWNALGKVFHTRDAG